MRHQQSASSLHKHHSGLLKTCSHSGRPRRSHDEPLLVGVQTFQKEHAHKRADRIARGGKGLCES